MLSALKSQAKSPLSRAVDLIERHPQTVVFATPLLRAREIKLAMAARMVGWRVILLYIQTTPFDPEEHFDVTIRTSGFAEMHEVAVALQPRLCHVFSGAIDEGVERFVADKPSPVILDLNDVFAPSLFNYCQERFEPTRKCIALADAICARDLQIKFAERLDGFDLPEKVLMFPEYSVMDAAKLPDAKPKLAADEVHVVSVGSFTLETQNMYDSAYLQMARMLTDQRIHFHVYPHWAYRKSTLSGLRQRFERDFAEFIKLEKETPFLHLHPSLALPELMRELPQYDFGIVAGGSPLLGQKLELLTQNYMDCCYSGRIADYLDARLPILINREVDFNFRLLKHYGIQIDLGGLAEPGFRETLLAAKQDEALARRVEATADKMSIRRNAERLTKFYWATASGSTINAMRSPLLFRLKRVPVLGRRLQSFEARMRNQNRHMQRLAGRAADAERALRRQEQDLANLQAKATAQENAIKELLAIKRSAEHGEEPDTASVPVTPEAATVEVREFLPRMDSTRAKLAESRFMKSLADGSLFDKLQPQDIWGLLNWPEIADPVERENGFQALVEMLSVFTSRPSDLNEFSNAWRLLAWKNLDELLREGFASFKRTLGSNYFNFFVQDGDPQIEAVTGLLTTPEVELCQDIAARRALEPDFNIADQRAYWYFVAALWQYVRRYDRLGLTNVMREPPLGRPLTLEFEDATVSQDLANSLLEYYAMLEHVDFGTTGRVIEIGAGHGRDAHVILTLNPHIQYFIVDIPPTLYISQRYLSSVFRDRKIFSFRDLTNYEDVRNEIESSKLIFLMPYQLELLPKKLVDHTLSISSFGEMTPNQVARYFDHIDRVTRSTFYLKQWKVSINPFDSLDFLEDDYPIKPHWKQLYRRPCAVQNAFFEAMYRIDTR